jgi:hypothetical protein
LAPFSASQFPLQPSLAGSPWPSPLCPALLNRGEGSRAPISPLKV